MKELSLNRWTTREVPNVLFLDLDGIYLGITPWLSIYYLCTFLYISYPLIKLKEVVGKQIFIFILCIVDIAVLPPYRKGVRE